MDKKVYGWNIWKIEKYDKNNTIHTVEMEERDTTGSNIHEF